MRKRDGDRDATRYEHIEQGAKGAAGTAACIGGADHRTPVAATRGDVMWRLGLGLGERLWPIHCVGGFAPLTRLLTRSLLESSGMDAASDAEDVDGGGIPEETIRHAMLPPKAEAACSLAPFGPAKVARAVTADAAIGRSVA